MLVKSCTTLCKEHALQESISHWTRQHLTATWGCFCQDRLRDSCDVKEYISKIWSNVVKSSHQITHSITGHETMPIQAEGKLPLERSTNTTHLNLQLSITISNRLHGLKQVLLLLKCHSLQRPWDFDNPGGRLRSCDDRWRWTDTMTTAATQMHSYNSRQANTTAFTQVCKSGIYWPTLDCICPALKVLMSDHLRLDTKEAHIFSLTKSTPSHCNQCCSAGWMMRWPVLPFAPDQSICHLVYHH